MAGRGRGRPAGRSAPPRGPLAVRETGRPAVPSRRPRGPCPRRRRRPPSVRCPRRRRRGARPCLAKPVAVAAARGRRGPSVPPPPWLAGRPWRPQWRRVPAAGGRGPALRRRAGSGCAAAPAAGGGGVPAGGRPPCAANRGRHPPPLVSDTVSSRGHAPGAAAERSGRRCSPPLDQAAPAHRSPAVGGCAHAHARSSAAERRRRQGASRGSPAPVW